MPFKTPDKTCEYIRSLLGVECDEVLIKLEAIATDKTIPILLPETAAVLKQLIMLAKPTKILEIGTAIGYSGHILLKSCQNSHLTTIEIREDYLDFAKDFFAKSGLSDRVTTFLGDASEILPFLDGQFDFIFMDGPKSRYVEYLPFLKKYLCKDGILLCDNVLFNGMIAGEVKAGSKQAIVDKLDIFLHNLFSDINFVSSILPVGDGLSLSIKK